MKRGNVLVIGNSGVGKSTLINAVLGEKKAITGKGTRGTTSELTIYESNEIPFRIIDSVGFEPSLLKARQAIGAVKKWSKESSKEGKEDTQINAIWFCVDGTASKLFIKTIKDLCDAIKIWKSIPIITVITKSYSIPERNDNIEMVKEAFTKTKKISSNLREIIPVVAEAYFINDSTFAPPEGITRLIETTNKLLPEGIRAAEEDISSFILKRKRVLAHGIVISLTSAGTAVGAVPIPMPDATILATLELSMVTALSNIYKIPKDENLFHNMIEIGTVSTAAKGLINALKTIPGINLTAAMLNGIIAGLIILALGESSIYVFEQIYLGNKSASDLDWIKKIIESKFSIEYIEKAKQAIESSKDILEGKDIKGIILEISKKFID
ncbi:MAG: DUF697 domain-containing protein [Anaerofustis stercorihominis]|nr:DUF697 domain-containing protein [Anaerofustis stercorihominis]